MAETDTRERILNATKNLLWQRGYELTSAQAIMSESGAGQGSLYHFFVGGKRELASAALEQVADALIDDLTAIFDEGKPGLQRTREWLEVPRKALAGCKLGRFAMENSVIEDDGLRLPVVRYFKAAERLLRAALRDAQKRRELTRSVDPDELAVTLLATVQGGYVLSRAFRDPDKLLEAVRGAERLLNAARTERET